MTAFLPMRGMARISRRNMAGPCAGWCRGCICGKAPNGFAASSCGPPMHRVFGSRTAITCTAIRGAKNDSAGEPSIPALYRLQFLIRVESATTLSAPLDQQRAWKLAWLTPLRCRIILAALLVLGFLGHLRYLTHDCPIDLSGDEAHYWDWSRRLDISYYSKGPMVAWLIRGSCALFGDNMPAVRLPALLLAVASSILTYWLALRLFKSDRIALGAVLLSHLVPMFVAGSVLMTIDPPFFFFWGLATCFAVKAIFDEKKWAWFAMGIAIGLGFWAKFTELYWLIGLLLFLFLDRDGRRILRSPWPWTATLVALLFAIPTLIWIHQHNYVTFRHIVKDSGEGGKAGFNLINFAEFIGGQVGAIGPTMAAIVIGAILFAFRRRRD